MKSKNTSIRTNLSLPWIIVALGLAGCTVGPEYRKPMTAVPEAYSDAAKPIAMATNAASMETNRLSNWWTVFGDPQLVWLVESASRSNLDVRIAEARLREARVLRRTAQSAFLPTLDGQAGYNRTSLSRNSINGQQLSAFGRPLENDLFDAAVDMRWELDVFGGRRRAVEAATAEAEASVAATHDILITVQAEVGLTYLELRGAQRQLTVARENLRSQEQTLQLSRDRFQAGVSSELDTARAMAQVAATRAQLPSLQEAQRRAIHRLGVLLGKSPQELLPTLSAEVAPPSTPPQVPIGLPSDLLRQRPDIRRAERQLASTTAQIGIATSELFPKFHLTAAAGLQSLDAGDFVDVGSRFWSLGPTMRWPIFNAGRIRQNIRVQNSKQEQALLRYEQTVLTSLEDVENALVAFGQEQERFRALRESASATQRSVTLANERYRGGLANFLDVLEAERMHLSAQDVLAQSERRLGQNLIRLFKAMGGGWSSETAI